MTGSQRWGTRVGLAWAMRKNRTVKYSTTAQVAASKVLRTPPSDGDNG